MVLAGFSQGFAEFPYSFLRDLLDRRSSDKGKPPAKHVLFVLFCFVIFCFVFISKTPRTKEHSMRCSVAVMIDKLAVFS